MVSASLNPANFYNNNRFLTHVVAGKSINDFASSLEVIVPTDYVHKNNYTDIDGVARSRSGEGNPGEIWLGSSAGPTLVGRLGVVVAVPGELNVGAYSPGTYYARFRLLMPQGSNGLYGIQNAVSGAAPVLTGMLALMLELNPTLSVSEARSILHQSARSDNYTGMVPNATWGHGKLVALAAIKETQSTLSLDRLSISELGLEVYPNPTSDRFFYRWRGQGTKAHLELMDLNGRKLSRYDLEATSGELHLPALPRGMYLLKLESKGQLGYMKLVVD
jgi:hypothetical protein